MNITKKVDWSDKLSIGVAIIDYQHQMILNLINEIIDTLENDTFKENISFLILELVEVVENHLRTEENILLKLNYSSYNLHHEVHQEYLQVFNMQYEKIDINNPETINIFIKYVKDWWIEHIIDEDKKFQEFVLEKGYK